MADTSTSSWNELDDTSSFTGSFLSASSSSTVPGPGAITGRFLKAVGERSLDLVVSMIIRRRMGEIRRTFENYPGVFSNPTGDKEWQRMDAAYSDLHELCRESRSDYYSPSLQRAAANLIWDITLITRPVPNFDVAASPTNQHWEALLVYVQRRGGELLSQPQASGESPNYGISSGVENSNDNSGDPRSWAASIFRRHTFKPRVSDIDTTRTSLQVAKSKDPPRSSTRKVLVLGIGGVGKSTFVKQIQAIVQELLPQDIEAYRDEIRDNMGMLLRNVLPDVNPSDLANLEDVRRGPRALLHLQSFDAIETILHELAVHRSIRRATLGMLPEPGLESADYFFDSRHRIFAPDYVPTQEDFVRSRRRTTGYSQTSFILDGLPWLLVDTGGESSQRRKHKDWSNITGLDDPTSIIFVVALSDYSQVNRMKESLHLFKSVANSPEFAKSSIVLLFTKIDIFAEKLKIFLLDDYFPDYTGKTFDDACQYFKDRFLSLVEDETKPIVTHFVCTVDSQTTSDIFQSIKEEVNKQFELDVI